ncbi:MAG: GGDEF domain-containing protein [Gammaproteobacteria bacterium]|nr:GGDEF domain-containing protein [Gammaproteobacteria bacterium]
MPNHLTNKLDAEELKGFARSMAELQWLLLILVILYFFIPTGPLNNSDALVVTMIGYSAFVLLFRYFNFRVRETRMKLAIETWAMIGFITVILWNTGYTESPLLNLYLLVIIACAITLGKIMTLLEVFLIACCYMYMGFSYYSVDIFSPETFTLLMARFSPFLLVAYVTSMLASDILAAKKKITLLSQTDELTGLLNMRAFNLLLEKELASAARYREPFSILMVDVDELKKVNDRFGHTTGSRMIQTVSRTLKNSVRASDTLARFGGDEFVVLMTQTRTEQARLAAERIRSAIANMSFDVNGKRIKATASIGIACFPECVEDPLDVLDKADQALYRSKQNGRNRVTRYQEEPAPPQSEPELSMHRARQYA